MPNFRRNDTVLNYCVCVVGYSLGGNAYWASGLHLFAPLPYVTHQFFSRIRIHYFATAGNLLQTSELVLSLSVLINFFSTTFPDFAGGIILTRTVTTISLILCLCMYVYFCAVAFPSFSDLTRNTRCSCGLGLHFRLGVAQIELNYAIPLKAQHSDL